MEFCGVFNTCLGVGFVPFLLLFFISVSAGGGVLPFRPNIIVSGLVSFQFWRGRFLYIIYWNVAHISGFPTWPGGFVWNIDHISEYPDRCGGSEVKCRLPIWISTVFILLGAAVSNCNIGCLLGYWPRL